MRRDEKLQHLGSLIRLSENQKHFPSLPNIPRLGVRMVNSLMKLLEVSDILQRLSVSFSISPRLKALCIDVKELRCAKLKGRRRRRLRTTQLTRYGQNQFIKTSFGPRDILLWLNITSKLASCGRNNGGGIALFFRQCQPPPPPLRSPSSSLRNIKAFNGKHNSLLRHR